MDYDPKIGEDAASGVGLRLGSQFGQRAKVMVTANDSRPIALTHTRNRYPYPDLSPLYDRLLLLQQVQYHFGCDRKLLGHNADRILHGIGDSSGHGHGY